MNDRRAAGPGPPSADRRAGGDEATVEAAPGAAMATTVRMAAGPSRAGGDGDLLLGLLAWKNDVLSDRALVDAVRAWAVDRSRPLGRVLVDRGDLDPERLGRLEGLAADRGLVAARSAGEVLRALNDLAGPDLQATLDFDPSAAPGGPGSSAPRAAVGSTSSAGRFRVVRPLARGNLGEVFVAVDEELHREVALKQIRPSQADRPTSRERFLLEAEVTGGLEHPGVVPIYGLGCDAEDRPYYAMRLIRGESLAEAIGRLHGPASKHLTPGERALELRRLLGRFVAVCNAVAYAHSRGILHRDLKPGNIMLGPFGETLVVDWGLAKVIVRPEGSAADAEGALRPPPDPDSALSGSGSVLGTPAYMGPEQAEGHSDRLGPACDIYSLGATLYCLLSGRAPFLGGDAATILAKVRAGEFSRPRQVASGVPAALEAICLKAMARRPEDRYASARALADDVERWLADEPVSAYREPPSKRAARWMRRHKPAVAGAAVLLVATVVALVVDDVRVGREKARAEANFGVARDAVMGILADVAAARLPGVPRAEELRRKVVDAALGFNNMLLAQKPSDPQVRYDAVRIFREAANIHRLLGRHGEAASSYRRAIGLLEGLAAEYPREPRFAVDLALALGDAGSSLRMEGRLREAEPFFVRAVGVTDRLLTLSPDDANLHRARGVSLLNLADVQSATGRAEEAQVSSARAIEELRPLTTAGPSAPLDGLLLAMALVNRARAVREGGRPGEAGRPAAEAIEITDRLAGFLKTFAGRPNAYDILDANIRHVRADALAERGRSLAADPARRGQAAESFGAAIAELDRLADESPKVPGYRFALAMAHRGRAEVLAASGTSDAAEADARRAHDLLEGLVRDHPGNAEFRAALDRRPAGPAEEAASRSKP